MTIIGSQLVLLCPWIDSSRAAILASALTENLGDINTPLRIKHFVAQCATETWGFRHLTESMFYNDPIHLLNAFPSSVASMVDARNLIEQGPHAIANRVYANRLGNGDEASGDGWRYRGRGFLQITGKYNYKQIGRQIGLDLLNHPEMLENPVSAAQAAVKFWDYHSCNVYADEDDINAVTARINPSLQGIEDRRNWLMKCGKIWQ